MYISIHIIPDIFQEFNLENKPTPAHVTRLLPNNRLVYFSGSYIDVETGLTDNRVKGEKTNTSSVELNAPETKLNQESTGRSLLDVNLLFSLVFMYMTIIIYIIHLNHTAQMRQ